MAIGNTNMVWVMVTIAVICQQVEFALSQDPPLKPSSVRLARNGLTYNSIELLVIGESGSAETHYTALYKHISTGRNSTFPKSDDPDRWTYHKVDGLSPNTNYSFCVYSVIKPEGAEDINSIDCRNSTVIATSRGPVTNVRVPDESVTETSILVTWDRPIGEYNTLIGRYIEKGAVGESRFPFKDVDSWTISELKAGTIYHISIGIQYIENGPELFSGITNALTKPYPPFNITSRAIDETTIYVSWDVPPLLEGDLTGYAVNYTPSEGGNPKPPIRLLRNERSITLGSLKQATNITVSVRAIAEDNDLKLERFSSPSHTSQLTKPLPPINVIAMAINDVSIRVSWGIPDNPPENGYDMFRVMILPQDQDGNISFPVSRDSREYTLRNLYPGRQYNISVRSVVGTEDSREAFANGGRGQLSKPSRPGNLSLEKEPTTWSPYHMFITWTNSTSENGVDRYNVSLTNGTGTIGNVEPSVTNHGVNISALRPGISYCVRVIAELETLRSDPSEDCFLTDEIPPEKPENVSVTNTDINSVSISWVAPPIPNGAILNFIVHHKECPGNASYIETNVGMKTTHTISGLRAGLPYEFIVYASNSKGPGDASETLIQPTDEDLPESVSNLQTTPTSRNLTITWQEPNEPNGIIRHYIMKLGYEGTCHRGVIFNVTHPKPADIRCWTDERYTDFETGIPLSSDIEEDLNKCKTVELGGTIKINETTAYTVLGLSPYTNYTTVVQSVNSKGPGGNQTRLIETLQDKPDGSPVDLKVSNSSSTSLLITWGNTVLPNGIITNYSIKYWEASNTSDNGVEVFTSEMQKEIAGLNIYTNYTVVVRAFTVIGEGPWSNESIGITGEDAPSQPMSVDATPKTAFSVLVSWQEPTTLNGIIRSYTVTYSNGTGSYPPIQVGSSIYEVNVTDLTPWTDYTFNVSATTIKQGPSNSVTSKTLEYYSKAVTNLNILANSSTCVLSTWQYPSTPNGLITHYVVKVYNGSRVCIDGSVYNITRDPQPEVQSYPIAEINDCIVTSTQAIGADEAATKYTTNLDPYQQYNVTVYAWNSVGKGESSEADTMTLQDAPGDAPTDVVLTPQERSFTVTFRPLSRPNGVITNYQSHIHNLNTGTNTTQNYTRSSSAAATFSNGGETINITGLEPFTNYSIQLRAYTSIGPGPWSNPALKSTQEAAPEKVSSFSVTPLNYTTVNLTWAPPTKRNGILREYVISMINSTRNDTRVPSTTQEYLVTGLNGYTNYTFGIAAVTVAVGDGMQTSLQTPEGPPTIVRNLKAPNGSLSHNSIGLTWEEPEIPHGIIRYYVVRYKRPQSTKDEVKNVTETTVTLDKLINGTRYDISVAAVTIAEGPSATASATTLRQEKQTDSPTSNVGAIVGGTIGGVLFLLIVIIIIVVLLKRNRRPTRDSVNNTDLYFREVSPLNQDNGYTNGISNTAFEMEDTNKVAVIEEDIKKIDEKLIRPIKVSDLSEYLVKHRENNSALFKDEFVEIDDNSPSHSMKIALNPELKAKNRYRNVHPFDHSRVILSPRDDGSPDYINASYLPGYTSDKEFIASQGPTPQTKDDFWHMIWDQKTSIIIMLTKCVENGKFKCEQYWPANEEPVMFGEISVFIVKEVQHNHFTVREFEVSKGSETRKLHQFAFSAWPDYDVPDDPDVLLDFVQTVKGHSAGKEGTPIVHCSAGVGRTGVYLTVDYMLQKMRESDTIDIFAYVLKLREYRKSMVQTDKQYIFIHDCIEAAVKRAFEKTTIPDKPVAYF